VLIIFKNFVSIFQKLEGFHSIAIIAGLTSFLFCDILTLSKRASISDAAYSF